MRPAEVPSAAASAVSPPAAAPAPATATAAVAASARAAPTKGAVHGRVEVELALAQRLPADTPVYVIAYAVDGPRVPLAQARFTLRELPREFVLDDGTAPNPAFILSRATQVIVRAHVSVQDRPIAAAVDPQGVSSVVSPRADGVRVVIRAAGP